LLTQVSIRRNRAIACVAICLTAPGVTKVRWNVTRLAARRLDLVHDAGERLFAARD